MDEAGQSEQLGQSQQNQASTVGSFYLGIDNGTQGLSVILCDATTMKVVATGEQSYGFVPNLPDGCYEQSPLDWEDALRGSMTQICNKMGHTNFNVLGIGISGQMHGEVLADSEGNALGNVRLWCDSRNEEEGKILTNQFQTKVPKRSTCARFLWTSRNDFERAKRTRHITTPAGWIHYKLTGQWCLGIGDASGMFPIDPTTLNYNTSFLKQYNQLVQQKTESNEIQPFEALLPKVCRAGEDAGCLSREGSELLGGFLPVGTIPVAAGEGDQPAAMAGSLLAEAGMTSMSFGTSVVANAVGDRPFQGVHDGVDQFCAVDGKPINMVWLRNGTTYMNTMVEMFSKASLSSVGGNNSKSNDNNSSNGFETIMPQVIEAPPDCGGLLALPFMDDEPGVQVSSGGTATMIGFTTQNATAGNVAKAALLSTIFNLKLGCQVLDNQGYPPSSNILLSGGLTKTPECSQIVADIFNCPVTLFVDSGEEGSAWGGALLGKYRHLCSEGNENYNQSWEEFLKDISIVEDRKQVYTPNPQAVSQYDTVFQRYQKLLKLHGSLHEATAT